jgi:hypothetical protein
MSAYFTDKRIKNLSGFHTLDHPAMKGQKADYENSVYEVLAVRAPPDPKPGDDRAQALPCMKRKILEGHQHTNRHRHTSGDE